MESHIERSIGTWNSMASMSKTRAPRSYVRKAAAASAQLTKISKDTYSPPSQLTYIIVGDKEKDSFDPELPKPSI